MLHNKSFGMIINEPKMLLLDDLFWNLMVHLLMTNLSYLGKNYREKKAKMSGSRAKAFTSLHQYQLQAITIITGRSEQVKQLLHPNSEIY